ncbi:MAG: WXG100 family type VII secretion target [Mycolicibacterium cosmeticum]|nr:WXG100 family type VII secretion target [Mycolicibacterium cosmeticum]
MHYRVELDELSAFIEKLSNFEQRAESIAADVDAQTTNLHGTWSGSAAASQQERHQEWMAAASTMREAIAELRNAATVAHRNYTKVGETNAGMWP